MLEETRTTRKKWTRREEGTKEEATNHTSKPTGKDKRCGGASISLFFLRLFSTSISSSSFMLFKVFVLLLPFSSSTLLCEGTGHRQEKKRRMKRRNAAAPPAAAAALLFRLVKYLHCHPPTDQKHPPPFHTFQPSNTTSTCVVLPPSLTHTRIVKVKRNYYYNEYIHPCKRDQYHHHAKREVAP